MYVLFHFSMSPQLRFESVTYFGSWLIASPYGISLPLILLLFFPVLSHQMLSLNVSLFSIMLLFDHLLYHTLCHKQLTIQLVPNFAVSFFLLTTSHWLHHLFCNTSTDHVKWSYYQYKIHAIYLFNNPLDAFICENPFNPQQQ